MMLTTKSSFLLKLTLICFLVIDSSFLARCVLAHSAVQSVNYSLLYSFFKSEVLSKGVDRGLRRALLPSHEQRQTITINASSVTPYLELDGSHWTNRTSANTFEYTTCREGDSASLRWFGNDVKCTTSSNGDSESMLWEGSHGQIPINPQSLHQNDDVQRNISCLPVPQEQLPSTWHQMKIINPTSQTFLSCLTIISHSRLGHLEKNNIISPKNSTAYRGVHTQRKRAVSINALESNIWSLVQRGRTGVSAMQLTVVSDQYALILDKVERNPLEIDGQPAWGALYNLDTNEVTPLRVKSNSFCAGGSFLGNGTMVNIGGNPPNSDRNIFRDADGLQAIRFYTPCDDGNCPIREYDSIKLTSPRWYPTSIRLPDGTVMIVGGCKEGAFRNSARINNPTIEYFPPKIFDFAPRPPIYSPFLNRTLRTNLFPIVIALPMTDMIFMAANNDAMLYNSKTNRERPLPPFPNGVRVTYPFTGSGLLLPLSHQNGYIPEVLICGGTNLDDKLPVAALKISDPASSQCVRMVFIESGIRQGWKIEQMPSARLMPDLIMMPDGKVLIVNGAKTGVAGYGNLNNRVGQSNADNPNFTPVLYDPSAAEGQRFSTKGMPTSNIPRLYHSTATLTPSGKIMIAGSNPNADFSTIKYQTEYRVEWLSPPYLSSIFKPTIINLPKIANYNQRATIEIQTSLQNLATHDVRAVLLDFGFITHSVHMNSRLVTLRTSVVRDGNNKKLQIDMPPSPEIYPPGYGWLHVLVDGIPSAGKRLMIGSGKLSV